ncbi:hypothetical protein B2J93_3185 [Marssonina coronariae]|uniref:Uncharacterized protein n=1 Tax=Diplocarpon coronariae TaxID=2795749 RepID=A0A218Z2Y7_9HELO|nr:hypothetical protein B2J93_3185 [Marssonina coronariae]
MSKGVPPPLVPCAPKSPLTRLSSRCWLRGELPEERPQAEPVIQDALDQKCVDPLTWPQQNARLNVTTGSPLETSCSLSRPQSFADFINRRLHSDCRAPGYRTTSVRRGRAARPRELLQELKRRPRAENRPAPVPGPRQHRRRRTRGGDGRSLLQPMRIIRADGGGGNAAGRSVDPPNAEETYQPLPGGVRMLETSRARHGTSPLETERGDGARRSPALRIAGAHCPSRVAVSRLRNVNRLLSPSGLGEQQQQNAPPFGRARIAMSGARGHARSGSPRRLLDQPSRLPPPPPPSPSGSQPEYHFTLSLSRPTFVSLVFAFPFAVAAPPSKRGAADQKGTTRQPAKTPSAVYSAAEWRPGNIWPGCGREETRELRGKLEEGKKSKMCTIKRGSTQSSDMVGNIHLTIHYELDVQPQQKPFKSNDGICSTKPVSHTCAVCRVV